jgi:long-chain fatty acid transport protein
MRTLRSPLLAALAVLLAPSLAVGAGYNIYEQGAAPMGMAGAGVASVHDASAVFYNPAVLSRLEGSAFQVGGTWLQTRNSMTGLDPDPGVGVVEEMKSGNFFPPTLYWTNRVGSRFAYGVGVNAPFGLGVEWQDPESFTGRTRITKANLQTINANLSLACALGANWSVAAGYNALFAHVELNNIQTQLTTGGLPVSVARSTLEGGFTPGYGWNAALHYQRGDWRWGMYHRSEIEVEIDDGDASFEQILTGDPLFDAVVAANLPAHQAVGTTLTIPAMWSTGLAWNPTTDWTWALDVNFTQWSAFEELPLSFADPALDQTIREDYQDQYQVRFGAEHRLPSLAYRFGYYYDQAAAPVESVTPLLPDANRHGATLGLGWERGKWAFDVYNLFLFVEKRSTEGRERDGYNGIYKGYVNALGASIGYRW